MPVEVFCSYAHEDEPLCEDLQRHLKALEHINLIRPWHDRRISPGAEWERAIAAQLQAAEIIVLLVSPDFLASKYCNHEAGVAMKRHESRQAVVMPVILRPCLWESQPFARLQVLPKDGEPVTDWTDPGRALLEAARGIERVANEWLEGDADFSVAILPEALNPRVSEAELPALEQNYLRQVKAELDDRQQSPLGHNDKEEIALEALILVEPEYKVFPSSVDPAVQPDRGKRTSNLVRTLLDSDDPVVVLGQPGAGKSVALRRVGLRLVEMGRGHGQPRIPVYLPLGDFTGRLTGRDPALAMVTGTLLKRGGHAPEIAARLDTYLRAGRMVFLLDAMDEMPREDYKDRFDVLRKLTNYRGNRFLFACRSLDYRESFQVTRAIIQPLSKRMARELLTLAMPDRGREAANRILSPDNPRRNLATNPFFLRLFCLYYKRKQSLPPSRAALVEEFENAVYLKASKYDQDPIRVGQRTMHLILARLGYLIATSQRGVTLPLDRFRREFEDGSRELANCFPHIDEVIHSAAAERLLVKDDHVDTGAGTVLSFYHHRLQEYYAAVYLDVFQPDMDWTQRYDDIWWQEILIMLFGITTTPERHINDLLATIPDPLTVPALAYHIWRLVSNRSDDAANAVSELDPSGFYGLRIDGEWEQGADKVIRAIFGKAANEVRWQYNSKTAVLAKASSDPNEEKVRQFLENRNAVLLDRAELAAECLENAAVETAEPTSRLATILSTFILKGNAWEAVRAIRTGSRLHGIDLYRLIEPALLKGNTWCRQEALEAVANSPVELSPVQQVSIVLFLQFLKGDLLFSTASFAKQVWERRVLAWLTPGFLWLAALSLAAALSPILFYWPLLGALSRNPHPPAALGVGWEAIAAGIVGVGTAGIYYLAYRFGISVLMLSAAIWAVGAAGFIIESTLNLLSLHSDANIALGALLAIALVGTPQLAQTVFTGCACLIATALFRSKRLIPAWRAHLQDIWSTESTMAKAQIIPLVIIAFPLVFGILAIIWGILSWFVQREFHVDISGAPGTVISFVVAVGMLAGFVIVVFGLLWSALKAAGSFLRALPRRLRSLPEMVSRGEIRRGIVGLRQPVTKGVGYILLIAAVVLVPGVVMTWLDRHSVTVEKLAVPVTTVILLLVILLALLVLGVPYLSITYYDTFGEDPPAYLDWFRGRFSFVRTEMQRLSDLLDKHATTPSAERYEAYRRELPGFRDERWRSVLYRQMEKAHKEMRQERDGNAHVNRGSDH